MKRVIVAALILLVLGGALARGQGCPPRYEQDFDGVTPPALPGDWTATQGMNVTGAPMWVTSTITPNTPPNSVFSVAPNNILDNRLDTPSIFAGIFDNSVTFNHSYDLEEGFDGAVLEISTPSINGGAFTDVTDPAVGGSFFSGNGYNSTISSASQSPIAGRMAWSGNSNGYVSVHLFLGFVSPSFHDHVVMRFRLATDNSGASAGWRMDAFRWHHNECSPPTPTATASATATATVPPTATPTASDCPGGVCTPSPTSTATATATATPPATPSPTSSPTATPSPTPAQALNISTRLRVETGDGVMIGGFIVTGSAPKKVAIRGLGPSLGNSGLSDLLADPTLELRGPDGALLMQNDNWQDDPGQAAQLTFLGLALPHPSEAGIVVTLAPGAYTAIVAGKNHTTGLGLVEIYDADTAAASQLANISTRGFVQTGNNVMIGGFILGQGSGNADVVVRGIGPSLSQFGLSNVLADPTLELRDSNAALLIANDNWQDDPISAAQLTARGLAPQHLLESGIFTTLPPGAFTSILAGKNGGTGIGLIEVYDIPVTAVPTPTPGTPTPTATATSTPAPTATSTPTPTATAISTPTPTPTAGPFIVTSTADSGAGSLRDAIAAAGDGDLIQFDAALNGQTISLTSAELVIDKNITISGPGSDQLAIARSPAGGLPPLFRIFHVMPGRTVRIEGLKISGGFTQLESGGGVFNEEATLTLDHCWVEGNQNDGGQGGGGGGGGGIYSSGASAILRILDTTVSDNHNTGAGGDGGGINSEGTLTITNSSVTFNSVPGPPVPGYGGGIFSAGSLEITNSTINYNGGGNLGGGIASFGSATITNSSVVGNTSILLGGGIFGGTMTITNSTISGNRAVFKNRGDGGGVYNNLTQLTITNSTLSDNRADHLGASIYNATDLGGGSGTVEIGNSILDAGLGANIYSSPDMVISHGYNLSSDDGSGFLTATGDLINTDPVLGPIQDNGGPTFTHALLTGSPAINAGDPNFAPPPLYDQRGPGHDRVVGGRIDVGSFELQP